MNDRERINWRLGFLRCWAVSSIIWVLGAVYVDFSHRPAQEINATVNLNSSDCEVNPNAGPWCNYQKTLAKYKVNAPDGTTYVVRVPSDLTPDQVMHFVAVNLNILKPSEAKTEQSDTRVINSPQKFWLLNMIEEAMSFPVLALLVFASFTWIFSGFKRRPT